MPNLQTPQLKLAIADDEPFNIYCIQNLIKNHFSKMFSEVHSSFHGQEILTEIQKRGYNNQFDLIILDQNMPIMNGDVVCSTVKNQIKQKILPDILIIISSANNSKQDNDFYKKAQADLIEPKPLSKERMNYILNFYFQKFKISN